MRKHASKYSLFLLFLLPLAILAYIQFKKINKEIDFTQKERLGLEYNQSLMKLLKDLQHHRGITNAYLSGASSFKDEIASEHSKIEEDIEAVDSINGKYGRVLKADVKWEEFKGLWKELEYSEYSVSPNEFFDGHTALIAGVISLISNVGETSNLILDPELPTYYLMDWTTFKSPNLIEDIGHARSIGVRAAATRAINKDEKDQLIAQKEVIKTSCAKAGETTSRVFSAKPDLKPRMEGAFNELDASVKAFLNMMSREIINAPKIKIQPSAYYETATKAIDAAFNLYDMKALALDKLLEARINGYRKEGYLFGSILIFISSAFIYLFAGFIKNLGELEMSKYKLGRQVEFLRDSRRYIQNILNSQEDIVIMTDGASLQYVNKSFLDFFGYERLEDFREDHKCLCDLFIKGEGFLYKEDGEYCIDPEISEKEGGFKVKMFDVKNKMERVFLGTTKRMPGEEKLFVISFKDISDIESESRRFEYLSSTDPLTRLCNRSKFDSLLDGEIHRAKRFKRSFSVVMFDIDQFKDVNDIFGHDAGDELLKGLPQALAKHIRTTDSFARWGGDEFVIMVVETPIDGAAVLAEKLRAEVEETCFAFGKVTCSFGVTEFKDTDDIATIIKRADEALYEAKNSGKNRVCLKG